MAAIIRVAVLPTHPAISAPQGTRLRQLLVLLLLAVGLLAGVSVSQTQELDGQSLQVEQVILPHLRQVHALARLVDEQRGMAALHLTLQPGRERAELEARLRAGRLQTERGMAALGRQLHDEAGLAHHRTVAQGMAAFWEVQDRLLAASRSAATDAAAGELARQLLAGEAQQAFLRLRGDIDAWWSSSEEAAAQQARESRAAAHLVAQAVWAMAALLALSLAVAWAVLRSARQRPLAQPQHVGMPDGEAVQAHLQALNAAVAAARRGEPGRAAGLSAQEAGQLAEQVDGAARGLRRLFSRPAPASASGHHPGADPGG